jgi:RNA polymerase sigma-70 factor (ECF subfamily)
MTRKEEQGLIERAVAGDRAAAEAIIRAHQRSLYSYLLRLSGSPEMAEDVTQEAFVRVLTHLERFDPRYRFSTWLFTIAKRLYVNACQKLKPTYDSDVVGGWRDGTTTTPESPTVAGEVRDNARDALQHALLSLGEEQREIVILFHQQGWSIALIAEHMGMPQGTVKSHLHRGRKRMRWFLDQSERFTARVEEVWG